MTLWQDTVKTALVGSERQSLALAFPADSALGRMLSQLEQTPAEPYVLKVAATLALYHQASWTPESRSLTPVPPCDLDDLPVCRETSQHLLNQILEGTYPNLLPEWLLLATQAGQRVPPAQLPALLNQGKQTSALRRQILPVLGKRGQWLATHHQAWDYVYGGQPLEIEAWQTESSRQRLALLEQLSQHDPAQVRLWLQSTWKTDPAEFRVSCLQILAQTLTSDDEPWLESLLDQDRSKQVRLEAAQLLARLPGSALCQRMIARVQPLLQLNTISGSQVLTAALPDQFTLAMERDGLDKKPQGRVGEKTWWLRQMLARIPPHYWCDYWQMSPEALLGGIDPQQFDLFGLSWTEATYRFRVESWAVELLRQAWDREGFGNAQNRYSFSQALSSLAEVVSTDHAQALCLEFLHADPQRVTDSSVLSSLLNHCQPWSSTLIDTFTECCCLVAKSKTETSAYPYSFHNNLITIANTIDPAHREWVTQALSEAFAKHTAFRHTIEQVLARLEFRQTLHQSFSDHGH